MRWLQTESARYALLLVVLLATATVAVVFTLSYMGEIVPVKEHLTTVSIMIWALTMGFMLIARAFGLGDSFRSGNRKPSPAGKPRGRDGVYPRRSAGN